MIVEGIVTTKNLDGSINVAPMGPVVEEEFRALTLRPFPPSLTYENLKREQAGVFHITDDACLIALAAVNQLPAPPEMFSARTIPGSVLADCCRWFEFRIRSIDETGERPRMMAEVIHQERRRDFLGFNRARHALIEAAILVSRIRWLGQTAVHQALDPLEAPIKKTGTEAELQVFEQLRSLVRSNN